MAAATMASPISPPTSPNNVTTSKQRPKSAFIRPSVRPRSNSRMSTTSKHGTRSSDEETKNTSVRVAVRVRPPLKPTDPGYDLIPQRFRGSTCHITSPTSLAVESAQGKKPFVFDRVFGEDVDQEGVWEYLNEGVNSFVQGYNVSVLAYGQSGAGKSYTMGTTGPNEQADSRLMGVVPRAAAALFETLSPAPKTGIRSPNRYSLSAMTALSQYAKNADKTWKMTATYVEIYQEQLRDLLIDESVPYQDRPQVHIREDIKGRILLTGLKQVPITSIEDLLNALNFGSSIRQTDATAVNARSSRSHAVFSLNLVQKKGQTTRVKDKRRSMPLEALSGTESFITIDSKLHFVDLAGSERLKNTGAYGERAKEGISINAGLASLGKVISQLSARSAGTHVSYRDSRLTRLLQDSLGGNAITYMIACVNPAEFHLSETLNTVQYAQRARAIQLKPQIQQIHDDSDKQAVIERLRAEIQFLRDQIRLSERSERRINAPQERAERSNEREIELQNQLLDIQENYSALSQRHAKVISDLAKSRDPPKDDSPSSADPSTDSAMGRLKRSSDFAEAVEQVVLEYEKTIQSLEASLSTSRSSLSNSESTLLEKETRIAYMETMNSQLQSRLQKSMDRETNDETYLRELEARVAGANTDEEKSNAMVISLKKELARIRDSEAGAEDYISTLEERLAEAEQQHETMGREIERLEHVIERQRSINKLDNLLYDLDQIKNADAKQNAKLNGPRSRSLSRSNSFEEAEEDQVHIATPRKHRTMHTRGVDSMGGAVQEHLEDDAVAGEHPPMIDTSRRLTADVKDEPTSPAQSRFVNDKLETVTQELFDLRVEHESTITSFDELQNKYQVALTSMAELQDALEESRRSNLSRPVSYVKSDDKRTLSAELDEVDDASSNVDNADNIAASRMSTDEATGSPMKHTVMVPSMTQSLTVPVTPTTPATERTIELEEEMDKLRHLNEEKETVVAELKENYKQLQDKHQDTLDYVEALKAETVRASNINNGRSSPNPQFIRRKAERSSILSDRGHRSFAAIRNLVLENFEEQPEKAQLFENNVSAALNEFHMRTERVQQLELELGSLRKEMDAKTALINGLTRERASMKSAPIDMSALATLEQQVRESENQIRVLQVSHSNRERELQEQIEHMRGNATSSSSTTRESGTFFDSEGSSTEHNHDGSIIEDHQQQLSQLQREVATWRSKHDSAMESMKASEKQLLATISDLQVKARDAEQSSVRAMSPEQAEHDSEKAHLTGTISSLQHELEEHKSAAGQNAYRLSELEASYNKILSQVEDDSRSKELTEKELVTHRNLVSNLENQLTAHKSAIGSHQEALESLRVSHSQEIDTIRADALKAQSEHNDKLAVALAEHQEATNTLQEELKTARLGSQETIDNERAELATTKEQISGLMSDATLILNKPSTMDNLVAHIQALVNARKDISAMHETASSDLRMVREELEALQNESADSAGKITELKALNEETMKELERVSDKELKSSRLVEELEEQLNSNFDQAQAANNRLSAMQTERSEALHAADSARVELERDLEDAKGRIEQLESELNEQRRALRDDAQVPELQRSNSGNGNLPPHMRASASPVNLPSPPPAIPLPPLPGPPGQNANAQQSSPPSSRHASKDVSNSAHAAQMAEDQEARIRTIEKHLFAEKQLTATLEEALTDLESSSTKMKTEMELWRRKCVTQEEELQLLRKEKQSARMSVQQMEDEAKRRIDLERQKLEERMQQLNAMNKTKRGKKSAINCF